MKAALPPKEAWSPAARLPSPQTDPFKRQTAPAVKRAEGRMDEPWEGQPEYNSQTAETRRPAVPGKEDIPQATGHRERSRCFCGTGRPTRKQAGTRRRHRAGDTAEEHTRRGTPALGPHAPQPRGREEQEALAYRSQQQEAATRPAAPTAGRPRGAKESPTEHQGERTSAQAARAGESTGASFPIPAARRCRTREKSPRAADGRGGSFARREDGKRACGTPALAAGSQDTGRK